MKSDNRKLKTSSCTGNCWQLHSDTIICSHVLATPLLFTGAAAERCRLLHLAGMWRRCWARSISISFRRGSRVREQGVRCRLWYMGSPGLCWMWQQFNLCAHPPPSSPFPSPSHQAAGMSDRAGGLAAGRSWLTEAASSAAGNQPANGMGV